MSKQADRREAGSSELLAADEQAGTPGSASPSVPYSKDAPPFGGHDPKLYAYNRKLAEAICIACYGSIIAEYVDRIAAALAAKGVVDPAGMTTRIGHAGDELKRAAQADYEQQLAALRAEVQHLRDVDSDEFVAVCAERDALRSKVAGAEKLCSRVHVVVSDPGMIGLANDILAALRSTGESDE